MSERGSTGAVVASVLVLAALAGGGYGLVRLSELEARCDGLAHRREAPIAPAPAPAPLAVPSPAAPPPIDRERLKEANERAGRLKAAISFAAPRSAAVPIPTETTRAVDDAFPEAMSALEADLRGKITPEKAIEGLGVPPFESWEKDQRANLGRIKASPEETRALYDMLAKSIEMRNAAIVETVKNYKETGAWDDAKLQQGMSAAMGLYGKEAGEKFPGRANDIWTPFWGVFNIPEQTKDQGDWQIVYTSDRNMTLKIRAEWK